MCEMQSMPGECWRYPSTVVDSTELIWCDTLHSSSWKFQTHEKQTDVYRHLLANYKVWTLHISPSQTWSKMIALTALMDDVLTARGRKLTSPLTLWDPSAALNKKGSQGSTRAQTTALKLHSLLSKKKSIWFADCSQDGICIQRWTVLPYMIISHD